MPPLPTPLAIDNDFFCKSEIWNIADLVLEYFGVGRSDCLVLPALRPQLQKPRTRLYKAHAPYIAKLMERVDTYQRLPEASPFWRNRMLGVHDIDPGEADLLAFVAENDTFLLATGDKRALKAVLLVPGLSEALRGKVVTIEIILLELCRQHGPEELATIMGAAPLDQDQAIQACFGSGRVESIMEGLAAYIDDLGSRTDPTIFWGPR